jgi:DNA polymerase-3 subunit delta'
VIGAEGAFALPWIEAPLRHALANARGHALLVHGPRGVGQFELSLALAQSWLCETPLDRLACGRCASCRLVQAHSHPDLLVLLPEALREPLGWAAGDDDEGASDKAAKRKPSKDIRVDEVRLAIAFAQTTAARGRGKVCVLHPAERMNGISANALLKTLEEPPGDARMVLGCAAPDALLPTIRSRCQSVALPLPDAGVAGEWLAAQGVAEPIVMLAAAGGQPQDALDWVRDGIDAAQWKALPRQLERGEVGSLAGWPLPRVIDAMQKLCHDAMRLAAGAAPRYFPASVLTKPGSLPALAKWARELAREARYDEHTWNAGLMVEALVQQATRSLAAKPAADVPPRARSLHSAG